jgi:hypothetical protein
LSLQLSHSKAPDTFARGHGFHLVSDYNRFALHRELCLYPEKGRCTLMQR